MTKQSKKTTSGSTTRTWRIDGSRIDTSITRSADHNEFETLVKVTRRVGSSISLNKHRSADSDGIDLEVNANDLIEVEFDDGLSLYICADDFESLATTISRTGDEESHLEITQSISLGGEQQRGLKDWLIKAIHVLDIEGELAGVGARKIAEKLEDKLIEADGLLQLDAEGIQSSPSELLEPAPEPILVLLHGTASNTEGSFGGLWSEDITGQWHDLITRYQGRVYGYEHKTVSRSPIDNALALAKTLPTGARLHLVSHSRGGLVGELLCRGEIVDGDPFNEQDENWFNPTKNPQLAHQLKEFGEPPDKDRASEDIDRLRQLNQLLKDKQFKIERFVRVACPARGTTLASERLDIYLSSLLNLVKFAGYAGGISGNRVFSFLGTLTKALVRERANPESLPGIEAMMPSSALIKMLNSREERTNAHLAVIQGDSEPEGIFKRLAMLAIDRFYGGDHDLVVDSASMEGGANRLRKYLFSDKGHHVNHFNYFTNHNSSAALTGALLNNELPAEFNAIIPERSIPRYVAHQTHDQQLPTAIIIPGISGSHLARKGDRVWVSLRLLFGKFKHLTFEPGSDHITPDEIIRRFYGKLEHYLSQTHNVICLDYDWRASVLETSAELSREIDKAMGFNEQPVHIIAHSMGGLVAHGMMAEHPETWLRMTRRPNSRVLMLGTPTKGSCSIPRLLMGDDLLTGLLSLADITQDESQWLNILRSFPAILELLPRYADKNFFKPETWQPFQAILSNRDETDDTLGEISLNPVSPWQMPEQAALDKAAQTRDILDATPLDARYVKYIAGLGEQTPFDVAIKNDEIEFIATPRGDGKVPWDQGIPEGIPCWYLETEHGNLANEPSAFDAILELLQTGQTSRLSTREPLLLTRTQGERIVLKKDRPSHFPSEAELLDTMMGVSQTRQLHKRDRIPVCKLSVSHGDLGFASSPIIVGHYQDDGIVLAEKVLDRRLNGRLSRRLDLGLYAGPLGSCDIVLQQDHEGAPSGAIIVGLGKVGSLTAGGLSRTYRDGLLKYALKFSECDDYLDQPIRVSTLLVGSNGMHLSLEDSISAMVRGLVDANKILVAQNLSSVRTIESLSFIELYEENAALSQRILNRMGGNQRFAKHISIEPELQETPGGCRRITRDDSSWWERLNIETQPNGALKFVYLRHLARAESELVATQRRIVDRFIEQATQNTRSDLKSSQALYELLIPREFKRHAGDNRNVLILVDDNSACYPWELLEYRDNGSSHAPSVEAGMVRQLTTEHYLKNPKINRNHKALVIGDPPSPAPELKGAQEEARLVAEKLKKFGCKTLKMIKPQGDHVIGALMTDDYQFLHLAGHGVFEYKPDEYPETQPVTGMIIGENLFLTAAEIIQMPSIPELVFINCCFLGKANDERPELKSNRHRLAANIATQLIRNGVRAVVASGWAVDDSAAALFAEQFYSSMLEGVNFGEAVRLARETTRNRYPGSNTWGAYQCYGDPDYHITQPITKHSKAKPKYDFVCAREARIELQNLASRAEVSNQIENPAEKTKKSLTAMLDAIPENWMDDARLLESIAKVYSELEQFDQAANWYQKAMLVNNAGMSIKSIEQLANIEARLALEKCRKNASDQNKKDSKKLMDTAIKRLNNLKALKQSVHFPENDSVERLCLMGSAYRRRAMLNKGKERTADLERMLKFYEDADALHLKEKGTIYPYPRINFLIAWFVLSERSRTRFKRDNKFQNLLEQTKSFVSSKLHQKKDFWDLVAATEIELLEAIVDGSLKASGHSISTALQQLKKRASSPRKIQSVMDNLEFLIVILDSKSLSNTRKTLESIIDQLRSK